MGGETIQWDGGKEQADSSPIPAVHACSAGLRGCVGWMLGCGLSWLGCGCSLLGKGVHMGIKSDSNNCFLILGWVQPHPHASTWIRP